MSCETGVVGEDRYLTSPSACFETAQPGVQAEHRSPEAQSRNQGATRKPEMSTLSALPGISRLEWEFVG
ncbi:MAG TPA: hypothetical protein PLZ16_05665, partial [Gammaproteobacteria bacterium]|nr:hypothetical protein [Gammaproteobacteria bacterium]